MPANRHVAVASSGASQPASSSGASQPASSLLDLSVVWARVRSFGRFPRRILDPQTEADSEENDLWGFLYAQKTLGISNEVWSELRSYGAAPPEDAGLALVEEIEAFVREYRRWPKENKVDKKGNALAMRLRKNRTRLDESRQVQLKDLQTQCEEAAKDVKKIGWRQLLDEVGKFVRDFERWPKSNDTHIKEDLLATRVAKAKKEFDVAHRTELQDLENKLDKDSRERFAEGLLKEVKDLGHWSNPPLFQ